ncbi:MAG: S8 family serine peptidase [Magnetovibrio sp.]|nr:S8 family serine peptidase [Magnetovibrio sp.]
MAGDVSNARIAAIFAAFLVTPAGAAEPDGAAVVRAGLAAACAVPAGGQAELTRRFAGARVLEQRVTPFRGQPGRARYVLLLEDGSELRITSMFPLGRLRRVTAEWHAHAGGERTRPELAATAGGDCRVREGRRLVYGADGKPERLAVLAPDLAETLSEEALNPAIPAGTDPGGVAVAVVDTGVNYTLDAVARRLARGADGGLVGYDFWDGDARPFDVDTGRSPFFPLHHGTAVTSIILREAPAARIIPYRFPRPEMTKMAELVEHADASGVVIVNMAMGSNRRADWQAFEAAARARPHMLFIVSAGNNGRDIDTRPVYPAALGLENILVVTSADAFGRLARGSNWGREHVDVMVPGEQVAVLDHRGVEGQASGSSFAVPRVAALAARFLAKHPAWRAPELKRAILSRAKASPRQPNLPLKHGWIPDPTDDFLPPQ